MKVVTWNVNGVRAREREVLDLLARERPELVCLQEIKAPAAKIPASLCELALPEYWCLWHGETAYSGVALHVRRDAAGARPAFSHPAFDAETRVVTAEVGDVLAASVYVPNGGKDYPAKLRFLDGLERFAADARAAGRNLLLCGDLNVARTDRDLHPRERKPGAVGQRPDERAALERFLAHGLVDLGRALHPDDDAMFTWWAPWRNMRQRNIGWRIDYVVASEALAARARRCDVLATYGTSDHAPLVAEFDR